MLWGFFKSVWVVKKTKPSVKKSNFSWIREFFTLRSGFQMGKNPEKCQIELKNLTAYNFTSKSFSVKWDCKYVSIQELNIRDELEFQLRYYRTNYKTDTWQCFQTKEKAFNFDNLQTSTKYTCNLRYRILKFEENQGTDSKDEPKLVKTGSWIDSEETLLVKTWLKAKEDRFHNVLRLSDFLNDKLIQYSEPDHREDTIMDKATRSVDTLMTVATSVGLGGAYTKIARSLWQFRTYGIAALIFRQELAQVVAVLGQQLNSIGKKLDMSSTEILTGCYYYLWESKKQRLYNPQKEFNLLSQSEFVLEKEADLETIEDFKKYFKFPRLVYNDHAAEVQWVLNNLEDKYELVCFRGESAQNRPGFGVFASKLKKEVIISVRGTKLFEDMLTNHSFATKEIEFKHLPGQKFKVHKGMYRAAKWLVSGGFEITAKSSEDSEKEEDGAGIHHMVKQLIDNGYSIVLSGHSLGASVAILTALLLIDLDSKLHVQVKAFATPPCTDKLLSILTQSGYLKKDVKFFNRIDLRNFINRDDIVSRLSLQCLHHCALEIKRTKPLWQRYVEEDVKSYKEKAKALWAPNQRSNFIKDTQMEVEISNCTDFIQVKEQEDFSLIEEDKIYIPGVIYHSYQHNGMTKASIVTGEFESFTQVQAFENMQEDHSTNNIGLGLRSIVATSKIKDKPSDWQSVAQNLSINCNVCGYFVGWNSSVGGNSGAVGVRAAFHCYNCGKLTCHLCSENKQALPKLGILTPVRVCNVCEVSLD